MSCMRAFLLLMAATAAAAPALARSCPEQGRLNFVGLSRGGTSSVWLSTTVAGSFRLDVDASGQTVDSWSKAAPGVHVTQSPVVGEDAGGVHSLVGEDGPPDSPIPCTISSQFQSSQGGGILPPGINWPSARPKPPIGIALRPEHPIAIAVRPRPPIGIAVKPERPIGIAVKPERPVGIAVKPEQPIGIAVKPDQPVGIAVKPEHPIGIAPKPEHPIGIAAKPEQPIAVVPAVSAELAAAQSAATRPPCLDPSDPAAAGRPDAEICPRLAPLTEGRDTVQPTAWNAWADINHGYVRDNRSALEGRAYLNRLTVGLDRLLLPDLSLGASIAMETGTSRSLDDLLSLSSDGVEVGPYLVWRLAEGLVLDLAYSYATADNDVRVGPFRGGYDSSRHQLSATLSGQMVFGRAYLRPAVTITHGWADLSAHSLAAPLLGQTVAVDIARRRPETGTATLDAEFGAIFTRARRGYIAPWAELGLSYAYQRLDDAEDLLLGRTDDLAGTARAGLRLSLSPSSVLEVGGGYLSLGQSGLDSWEARALVSFGF